MSVYDIETTRPFDITQQLLRSFWEEIEEIGLAVMAAGVPLSQFEFAGPSMVNKGYSVYLEGGIVFRAHPAVGVS